MILLLISTVHTFQATKVIQNKDLKWKAKLVTQVNELSLALFSKLYL